MKIKKTLLALLLSLLLAFSLLACNGGGNEGGENEGGEEPPVTFGDNVIDYGDIE